MTPTTPPAKTPSKKTNGLLIGLVAAATVALVALLILRYTQDAEPVTSPLAGDIQASLDACTGEDVRGGLARLDSLNAALPGNADILATRALCRSVRFAADSVQADARAAFADLSAAIAGIQMSPGEFQTPLDRLYHQRAFLVLAMRPNDWAAALADLDRAVELNPEAPGIVLDRGMARAMSGDTDAARADLRRYERLMPEDSTEALGLRNMLQLPAPQRETAPRDTTDESA